MREESGDLLIDLHLRIQQENMTLEARQKITSQFLSNCQSMLVETKRTGEKKVIKLLLSITKLISDFLDGYDGKLFKAEQGVKNYYGQQAVWNIQIVLNKQETN